MQARNLAAIYLFGALAMGCGGSRHPGGGALATASAATTATTSTATGGGSPGSAQTGWSGSYVGRYGDGQDQGTVALLVYPDLTLVGMAVSDLDPDLREVVLGQIAPDGSIPPQVGFLGTTFSGSLASLQGTYQGLTAGTFTLQRALPDDLTGVYTGTTINETLGVGGVWTAVVDASGGLTALFAYPTLGFVSEGLRGVVDPASASVQLSGPNDVGQGRFENGFVAGRWSARDGSQVGSWQGFKAPPGLASAPTSGLSGAYLGRYTATSGAADQGRIGVIVYPDRSFLAVAISEVDPDLRDVGTGFLAPDGSLPFGVSWYGTTVIGNLTSGGSYSNAVSSGTFTLQRTQAGQLAGISVGALFNQTLGVPGLWISLSDDAGSVLGLSAYPTLLQLSEGLSGSVSAPSGGVAQVTVSGPLDTAQGLRENGMSGGTWAARDGSQRGTWTGLRTP